VNSHCSNRRICWCSCENLLPFSDTYSQCSQCGTLVFQGNEPSSRVLDDSKDFYSRTYWFDHQETSLGLPNIEERAVGDLPERCVYWVRHLLEYCLPPARVLELGCAHGGSVALMRWAGYDAVGLELSPWVVDFAEKNFGIQVLLGPVEDQELPRESFDAVCMFDVMEHLVNPMATVAHCTSLLKPGGLLVVQTPEIPWNADYEEMKRAQDLRLQMLVGEEHLFLFSRKAAHMLLTKFGFHHVEFLTQLFPYDMFFVASRRRLEKYPESLISNSLCSSPSGRLILALVQLQEKLNAANRFQNLNMPLEVLSRSRMLWKSLLTIKKIAIRARDALGKPHR
jgi:2-polyprenyl-3-methyl-5-hydroxy-6-metoxy-1,4-benzoquinol methylase